MTTSSVLRVDRSNLSLSQDLGRGGQGRVAAVDGFKVHASWPAAIKIYAKEQQQSADASVLEAMVALPRQLSDDDRAFLLDNTAWPAVIVQDDGALCGFLMRAVPSDFYFDFQYRTMGRQRKLADFAFLLNPEAYVRDAGLVVDDRQRLLLLQHLATLLTRLHAMDIVVGDLSPKNLIFKLTPQPRCFLIDCDASQLSGEVVLTPVETPDWKAPEGGAKASKATDAYKFGLLAVRLFAHDQSVQDVSAITAVTAELGQLATRSLQSDPQSRPAPQDWMPALDAALAQEETRRIQAATIVAAPLSPTPAPAATPPPGATTVTATPPAAGAGRIGVSTPIVAKPAAQVAPTSATGTAPRRRGSAVLLAALAALAVLALVITGVVRAHLDSAGGKAISTAPQVGGTRITPTSDGNSASLSSTPAPPPTPHAGVVRFGDQVQGNSQAMAVGRMLNNYFSGIDDGDYQRSVNVFSPYSPIVNPNSPLSEAAFAKADRTSQDTDVMLVNLDPADGSTVSSAEVKFQSTQKAGLGPPDARYETCTDWDIVYNLTTSPSGAYQIYDTQSDVDTPC